MVIAVHALDGSPEADRLDALGTRDRQAAQPTSASCTRTRTRWSRNRHPRPGRPSGWPSRASPRPVISAPPPTGTSTPPAPSHQGVGPLSEPAVNPNDHEGVVGYRRTDATPEVDERPVRLCLQHVSTPLPGRQQPANPEHAAGPEPSAGPEQPGKPAGPARAADPEQPAA